jgi:hypothetical protein
VHAILKDGNPLTVTVAQVVTQPGFIRYGMHALHGLAVSSATASPEDDPPRVLTRNRDHPSLTTPSCCGTMRID